MRKLIVVENVSLDGVIEAPEQWAFAYQNAEIAALNKAGMNTSDALLLGRVTYTDLAGFWPHQTNDESGIADYINNQAKFVVSSTLKKADWHNTTILSGDLVEEITRLKGQRGKHIVVIGSARLVQSLMKAKLIDEYQLFLMPLVLGRGKQLFPAGMEAQKLQLVETTPFSSGAVLMRYQPATQ
ncbi:dihydrofolate reductase family protein [soil metagenome]